MQSRTILGDAYPRTGNVDVAQSGYITILHTSDIEFYGCDRRRTDDALGQRVAGPHQLLGRHGIQVQSTFFEAPHLILGVVVPLPDATQLFAVEVVAALVGGVGLLRLNRITLYAGLQPCAGGAPQVALQSQVGPAVFPCDRGQRRGAADGMEIHHEQCPPLSALVLYDATLVDVGAGCSVLVHWGNAEFRAVGHDAPTAPLRQRCSMVAKGLVGGDGDGLIRSPDALRP